MRELGVLGIEDGLNVDPSLEWRSVGRVGYSEPMASFPVNRGSPALFSVRVGGVGRTPITVLLEDGLAVAVALVIVADPLQYIAATAAAEVAEPT